MARLGIYTGPDLGRIADDGPALRAMERMASKGGDRMHSAIAGLTPVATGNLATSWYRMPTVKQPHGVHSAWVSRVATDVSYAPPVEYGSGIYGPEHRRITPRKPGGVLSWIDPLTGKRIYAKSTKGMKGRHMVARGTALVEGFLHEIMAPELEAWKREQEAVIEAARV